MLTGTATVLSTHEEYEHTCYTHTVFPSCKVALWISTCYVTLIMPVFC